MTETLRPPVPGIVTPTGLGSYVRGEVALWTDADAARRAAYARAAGLRWVALMVEAVDGRRPPVTALRRAARAYHAQGLAVWMWSFPHCARRLPEYVADDLEVRILDIEADGVPVRGVILDIEATDGGETRPSATWAAELVLRTVAILSPTQGLGVSSYPIPAWHRMPWSAMAHPRAWGSPQIYETATQPSRVSTAMAAWGRMYGAVVPSLPVYDLATSSASPSSQLASVLDAVLLDRERRPRVAGAALWSDTQIDRAEAAVLRAWAERHGW